ncbi:MAG: ATP-binding protein [Dehalogenimonas sp.]
MSIRLKLFITYSLAVIFTLALAALGSTVLLRGYADRLALENLRDTARPISVQLIALVRGDAATTELIDNLQEQADINNVYIFFVSRTGSVLRQFTPTERSPISVTQSTFPQGLTQTTTGDFISADDETYLYAAYPLGLASQQVIKAQQLAVVIPQPKIGPVVAGLIKPFAWAGIIALAGSLILALWLARSVSKPVKKVIVAADTIARGDYKYRIRSKETGDLGDLARSFDHMADEVEAYQLKLKHFAADVSHELKSPLTAIQGFSQALIDGTAVDELTRHKAAQVINDESRRLGRQIDELLDLSHLQSGSMRMQFIKCDTAEILRQSVDLLSIPATDKSIALELTADSGLWVMGDPDRLEQVFNNLLDNAIKNSPSFSKINIEAHKTEDKIIASVIDEGPGIHPEQLERVFDRFYQINGLRTGVGLGLAISKEIIIAHHGNIEARSAPGTGAKFVVSLPAIDNKDS